MKPYEFKGFYHPRLGRFEYMHKGSGIIVDNIFKPVKSVLSSVFRQAAKTKAKNHMLEVNLEKKNCRKRW